MLNKNLVSYVYCSLITTFDKKLNFLSIKSQLLQYFIHLLFWVSVNWNKILNGCSFHFIQHVILFAFRNQVTFHIKIAYQLVSIWRREVQLNSWTDETIVWALYTDIDESSERGNSYCWFIVKIGQWFCGHALNIAN